jgi:hypothetical protein
MYSYEGMFQDNNLHGKGTYTWYDGIKERDMVNLSGPKEESIKGNFLTIPSTDTENSNGQTVVYIKGCGKMGSSMVKEPSRQNRVFFGKVHGNKGNV